MTEASGIQSTRDFSKTVTIPVGQSDSGVIDIFGTNLVSLIVPANMTASYINFLVSDAIDGNFVELHTNSIKTPTIPPVDFTVALNVVAGKPYSFKPEDLSSWQFIKIKSVDVDDVADNQLATDAVIKLVLRPIS